MTPFRYSALLTDFYELTMLAGYFEKGMHEDEAVFDLFFRKNPFKGSYAVFAGLETALRYLEELRFTDEDIAYLDALGKFSADFLDYLRDFRFRCKVIAPPEGTLIFNHEPLLTVEGKLAEAQLVETALLNIVNYQTLIATKAARIQGAAGDGVVLEFGLRRAHGPDGGLSAARGAFIGGVRSTSNVWAGQVLGIEVKGTHAHSWVMAFADELSSFRAYADVFPDSAVLLVDTYDTLRSGVPNAITVAQELRDKGHELLGIRLDSGDLAYLSKQARHMLDEAGFPEVKIVASNELDEYVIDSIRKEGGRIDIYGVGTNLVTAAGEGGGHLGGVYKLVRHAGRPKLKVTSDVAKATLPDRKRLIRVVEPDGTFHQDVMCCENESLKPGDMVFDPTNPAHRKKIPEGVQCEDLRQVWMDDGKIKKELPALDACADHCAAQLKRMPNGCLRLYNPHIYKVSISQGLNALRSRLMEKYLED
ncbi:nicotinate phosphoribosyltransferase [Geoalkalibacter ferrihydriticus]|uniref:Nicotinate phosphoribosyltransferase n=2 Tax=Geoalkalibacter ferrihydriticus TaxID=392333 RepID=A0A0C2EHQ1_9BACT|nr:nicotinate phosphoribosyltransferase [Geoalkalibacter ferrihydriticus]KIH78148.1 nicotinate phosphoribosyltransferase [Geoalkalibacter ferrihydriticus DSM 17813]SDM81390.1 nicotinate phosphoribosyltransferase [Geoalkalibacter ferrihydriticus]